MQAQSFAQTTELSILMNQFILIVITDVAGKIVNCIKFCIDLRTGYSCSLGEFIRKLYTSYEFAGQNKVKT